MSLITSNTFNRSLAVGTTVSGPFVDASAYSAVKLWTNSTGNINIAIVYADTSAGEGALTELYYVSANHTSAINSVRKKQYAKTVITNPSSTSPVDLVTLKTKHYNRDPQPLLTYMTDDITTQATFNLEELTLSNLNFIPELSIDRSVVAGELSVAYGNVAQYSSITIHNRSDIELSVQINQSSAMSQDDYGYVGTDDITIPANSRVNIPCTGIWLAYLINIPEDFQLIVDAYGNPASYMRASDSTGAVHPVLCDTDGRLNVNVLTSAQNALTVSGDVTAYNKSADIPDLSGSVVNATAENNEVSSIPIDISRYSTVTLTWDTDSTFDIVVYQSSYIDSAYEDGYVNTDQVYVAGSTEIPSRGSMVIACTGLWLFCGFTCPEGGRASINAIGSTMRELPYMQAMDSSLGLFHPVQCDISGRLNVNVTNASTYIPELSVNAISNGSPSQFIKYANIAQYSSITISNNVPINVIVGQSPTSTELSEEGSAFVLTDTFTQGLVDSVIIPCTGIWICLIMGCEVGQGLIVNVVGNVCRMPSYMRATDAYGTIRDIRCDLGGRLNVNVDTLPVLRATASDSVPHDIACNDHGHIVTTNAPNNYSVLRNIDLSATALTIIQSTGYIAKIMASNQHATSTRYLKCYNQAPGATPDLTVPLWPVSTQTIDLNYHVTQGFYVKATAGIADSNAQNPSANDVVINAFYCTY